MANSFCHIHTITVDGKQVTDEQFRQEHLVPLCGERQSHLVMGTFLYQVCAYANDELARKRLQVKGPAGENYINCTKGKIKLLLRCNVSNNVCHITVVECSSSLAVPP